MEKIIVDENERKIFAKKNGEEIEIQTKLVVGADGDHSVVLKSLGERKIDRANYASGLRQYWKDISNMQHNHLELYLPKSLPLAYLWIFPLPNGEANVGCGLQSAFISKKNINLKNIFNDIITNDPVISNRFKHATPLEKSQGWGLPLASLKRKTFGDGWLLTGDAASLICPTTGEGIGPAMMSGYIAAHFIERAVKTNNFSETTFKNYDREIYKRLNESINTYNIIQHISPMLYNFIINTITPNSLCRHFFKKNVVKWIQTAYTEKIEVNID